MASIIESLVPFFEHFQLSPPDWPVQIAAVAAGAGTFRRWPDFPRAATVERRRLGHGRGMDRQTCIARALGEMIEIASCCAWGDEDIAEASEAEIGSNGWGPAQVIGFSAAQRRDRQSWNGRLEGLDWIAPEPSPGRRIGWMTARSLFSGERIWVPADTALIGRREPGDPQAAAVADTNGCACGETADGALLMALYELIERDATGRWWYGGRARAAIAPSTVAFGAEISGKLEERGRALRLLDITSDIGVPTVAAVSADRAGRRVAAGFATRAELSTAAQAALTELMQTELRIAAALSYPDLSADLEAWLDINLTDDAPFIGNGAVGDAVLSTSVKSDLATCLALLSRTKCRVAAVELTRRSFGLPVFRAISPDLCHWKPRFGRARLLEHDRRDLYRHPKCIDSPNPELLRV